MREKTQKKSEHNFTATAVVLSVFFSLLFFSHDASAAFVQSSSTMQTPSGVTSSIAFTNLTPGNTILISCSASIGGSNFQATSGNHIYFGSNASDTATLDSFASASTYLGQWIFRSVISSASTTYSCFNSQGLAGYVYMSATEFSDTLSPLDEVSSSSVAMTTNATDLGTGSAGDLVYMVHFQDYFSPQGLTPTDSAFVSSTRVEYTGQSRQEVYYDYRADGAVINTEVTGWHYNDLGIANAVRYAIGSPPAPSVSASFAFPTNGSTTADFSNWVISLTGTPNSVGEVRIYYATNDGTAGFLDRVGVVGEIISPLAIHKAHSLVGNYSTSTWIAYIVVNDLDGATIYTSDVIQFHIGNELPPFNSTTSLAMPFNPQAFQNTSATYPSSTTALFGFQEGAFNFIQQQWIQFRSIFPFSIVFGFASTTEDAIRNASTSNANYDLYVNTTLLGMPVRFPILTSTTLEFVVGSSTKATIFDIERKFLWLGAGAFILFSIL